MTRPSIDELVKVATEAGWPDEPSKVWPEDVENAVRAVLAVVGIVPTPALRLEHDGPADTCPACLDYVERMARLEQEGEWE